MRTQSPGAVWDSAWYKSLKVFRSNTFKWKTIKTILALLYYESKYTSYMWQLFYYVQPYIAYRFSWPPKLQGWNQAILDRLEPELVSGAVWASVARPGVTAGAPTSFVSCSIEWGRGPNLSHLRLTPQSPSSGTENQTIVVVASRTQCV